MHKDVAFRSTITKRLGIAILVLFAALGVSGGQSVYAATGTSDCGVNYACSSVPTWNDPGANPNPNYPARPFYGALASGRGAYSSNCMGHYTKSAVTNTWNGEATKQPNSQCWTKEDLGNDARGNAWYLTESPEALQQLNGGGAITDNQGPYSAYSNHGMVDELLWFTTPGASVSSPAEIPFQLCFKYATTPGPNPTISYAEAEVAVQLAKFVYLGSTLSQITWSWTGGVNSFRINRGSAPNWTTYQCNPGKFKLTGPGGIYTSRTTWETIGTAYFHPLPIYQSRRNGKVEGCFQITPDPTTGHMPSGVTCQSASGVFPGCEFPVDPTEFCGENKKKEKDTCSANTTANPINFAYGFKVQKETDYSGSGALAFVRTYRSNGDWLNFNMGKYWRHNYDRSLQVVNGPALGSDSARITTSDGTAYMFRSDAGDNDWQSLDSDVKATFTELYNATPTLIGYLYTDEHKNKETYNTSKKLTRIEYQGGEALDMTYDGSGRLSTVTDEHGQVITLTYDGSSRVSTAATPDGTFTYTYGSNNNLTQVTKPDTKTRIYHYEDTTFVNALTGITNEDSVRYATWGYDAQGRADSSEHAGGVDNFTLTYNSDGTITETNPLGKQTIYTYTVINGLRKITKVDGVASASCPAANKLYTYTSSGYLASTTDWEGNVTNYTTDADGFETSRVEAVGTPEERTTTTTWVPSLRLPDVITEAGRTTDYAYDGDGRMSSVTVTDTNTSETRTTTYTYWSNSTGGGGHTILGRLKEIDGPRTDVTDKTTFTYDSDFRLIKTTDALGHETETTAFDAADRPLTVEDENDVETDMAYDTMGRVLTVTRAPGTALEAVTTFTYTDVGDVETVESPNGTLVTYTYDNARRLTGMEDDLGNTITYTLDDAGNILTEERRDPGNTLKYTHTQTFDELSRLLTSVGAGAAWDRSYAYDKNSNMTTYTDANSNATAYAFDGLDRLVTTTDALSGVTESTINDLNQTTAIEDPRTNVTTYGHNAFGDVTQVVSPDTGTASYTHDKAGNVTQMIDARSVTTNYTYDAINRLATVAYPSDSSLNVTLTYDDNPTPGNCGTSIGRLCRTVDAAGTTDYKYNDLGQLIEVKEVRGGLTFTTEYEYDLAGVLTEIELPSGREIDYTLNGNGQVSSVAADVNGSATTLASSIAYLPYGPLSGLTYGNSKTLSATYDQDYRPTNRTVSGLFNHTYDTDDEGNITQKGSRTYTYDDLNRMDTEAGGTSASFTYDAIGNRLTEVTGSTTTYTYPSTNSKVSSVGANSYTYDGMGNVTGDGARTYVWSAAGLLKESKIGGSTVGAYTYSSNNQRTKKVAGGNTVHYVYGLGGLLYGEYDNSGNLIREYAWLNGEPLAQIDAGSPEVLTYLHMDHLATPRYGTNAGGSTVWTWDSGAFGKEAPTGSATVNLRFPGQYYDSESTLHYNWNRYYNPATGRYISSDPMGLSAGMNTYNYANVNPLMFADPEGLRGLTAGEIELAQLIFKDSIQYSRVSISEGAPVTSDYTGITLGYNIYVAKTYNDNGIVTTGYYSDNFANSTPEQEAFFIHEMAHVWQWESGLFVALRRVTEGKWFSGYAYEYELGLGKRFEQYGIEAQASIIEDYFRLNYYPSSFNAPYSVADYAIVLCDFLKDPGYLKKRNLPSDDKGLND